MGVDYSRNRRIALKWFGASGLLLPLARNGLAEASHSRRLIVPAEAGGGIDSVARLLAYSLSISADPASVVLNRPGASGNLGAAQAARSVADGETLLITGANHLSSPLLLPNAGFDPITDFSPLIRLALAPSVVLVSDALKGVPLVGPSNTQPIAARRLSFGSAGYGHSSHFAVERFKAVTRAPWLHVPYKGTAPALRALMAEEVQVVFAPLSSVAMAVQSGRVHAVAVAHNSRLSSLPQVPTLKELGVLNAEYTQWYGVLMPRSSQEVLLDGIVQELLRAAGSPRFTAGLERLGLEPGLLPRKEFSLFMNTEMSRMKRFLVDHLVDQPAV